MEIPNSNFLLHQCEATHLPIINNKVCVRARFTRVPACMLMMSKSFAYKFSVDVADKQCDFTPFHLIRIQYFINVV